MIYMQLLAGEIAAQVANHTEVKNTSNDYKQLPDRYSVSRR